MRVIIILCSCFLLVSGGCGDPVREKDPMLGVVYREKDEVAGLKAFEEKNSSVIQSYKNSNGEFEFAIALFQKENRYVVAFERLVREENNPKIKYEILDVVNIETGNKNESVTFGTCETEAGFDEQIIALVQSNADSAKVLKAWRVNLQTERIDPIENTTNVSCMGPVENSEEGD